MPDIQTYTNGIQDGKTQRAVFDLAYQITQGNFTPKISGTAITSSATELNKLTGVSVTATEMDQRAFTVVLNNVSVAKSVYAVVPWTGNVTTIYCVGNGTTLGPVKGVFSFSRGAAGNMIKMSGNTIAVSTGATVGAAYGSVSPTSAQKSMTVGNIMKFSANGKPTGPAINVLFTVLMDIT